MMLQMTLLGGPPWGLRLGGDQELRPVVSKILMGGRAARAGVRAGDLLQSVNSMPVFTCKQAHTLIQKAHGQLRLVVNRNVAGESAPASRFIRSIRSSTLPGPAQHAGGAGMKSVRLDLEAASGATKLKRRFFEEQIAKSSVTDRLLQRKIQLGMTHNGAPSESTIGYDSVEADFAGGQSNTTSNRTSPSLVAGGELDEITVTGAQREQPRLPTVQEGTMSPDDCPRSETVVPDRRSVADLRRQITSRLEMKAPESSRCPARAEATKSPVSSPHFPHNCVKVHEGADNESKKPWLGRVLDGPVPPEKFYQGVMPPSLLQSALLAAPPSSTKPPCPLAKPVSKQYTKRNSFLNRLAKESSPDESQSYGGDQCSRPLEHSRGTPSGSGTSEETHQRNRDQAREESEPSKYHQTSFSTSQHQLPRRDQLSTSFRTVPFTERSFDTVFQTNATENAQQPRGDAQLHAAPPKQEPQTSLVENRMPDLLKSRSPAPFSYSASPNPDPRLLPSVALQELTSSLNEALASFARSPPVSNVAGEASPQKSFNDHATISEQKMGAVPVPIPEPTFDAMLSSPTGNWSRSGHDETHSTCSATPSDADVRQEGQVGLLKGSEPPASSAAAAAAATEPSMYDRFLAGPSSHSPEMSLWYRNMFKKMHRIESPTESSVLRHRLREESPGPTISRPLTPLTFTAHAPSRHECEVTPRRARSVGRFIEADMPAGSRRSSANLFALEKSRTSHFHLPSYKFVHEDPRPIVSDCRPAAHSSGGCGVRCLRCGLRRRDPQWAEIDAVVNSLIQKPDRPPAVQRSIQSKAALRCITENLDDTARELAQFIQRLEQFWTRSNSSPQLSVCVCSGEGGTAATSTAAEEIAELKRLSKEELLYRQKAERLAEELQEQRSRRHGYIPTASPSVISNKDRFGGLLDEYSRPTRSSPIHATSVRTATAIFKFDAKSPKELSLNRGDVVRVRREVDVNWLEGERNGQSGLFPRGYVQLDDEFDRSRCRAKAVYPFTARRTTELSLKMDDKTACVLLHSAISSLKDNTIMPRGETVTLRREIDENWLEGTNHLGEIGMFPRNYVELLNDQSNEMNEEVRMPTNSPDRPKTPKVYDKESHFEPFETNYATHSHGTTNFARHSDMEEDHYSATIPNSPRSTSNECSSASRAIGLLRNEGFLCTADKIPKGSQTYRAVYPYSPMKEDEVSLQVDDIIFVVEKCEDGWFIGTVLRTGQFGTFPGNYVERH